ncbi:hypothetical protein GBA52_024092 [Prunus armeniaca]|nr:hypothetical protein GBA52_024092 [Prunus armeniaca]
MANRKGSQSLNSRGLRPSWTLQKGRRFLLIQQATEPKSEREREELLVQIH